MRKTFYISTDILLNGDDMETVTVSPKYQVVIPASIREHMDIKPGQKAVVMESDGIIYVVPIGDIRDLRGTCPKLTTEGLRDERDRY